MRANRRHGYARTSHTRTVHARTVTVPTAASLSLQGRSPCRWPPTRDHFSSRGAQTPPQSANRATAIAYQGTRPLLASHTGFCAIRGANTTTADIGFTARAVRGAIACRRVRATDSLRPACQEGRSRVPTAAGAAIGIRRTGRPERVATHVIARPGPDEACVIAALDARVHIPRIGLGCLELAEASDTVGDIRRGRRYAVNAIVLRRAVAVIAITGAEARLVACSVTSARV